MSVVIPSIGGGRVARMEPVHWIEFSAGGRSRCSNRPGPDVRSVAEGSRADRRTSQRQGEFGVSASANAPIRLQKPAMPVWRTRFSSRGGLGGVTKRVAVVSALCRSSGTLKTDQAITATARAPRSRRSRRQQLLQNGSASAVRTRSRPLEQAGAPAASGVKSRGRRWPSAFFDNEIITPGASN